MEIFLLISLLKRFVSIQELILFPDQIPILDDDDDDPIQKATLIPFPK